MKLKRGVEAAFLLSILFSGILFNKKADGGYPSAILHLLILGLFTEERTWETFFSSGGRLD